MIGRQKAIAILQEHINTYHYQITDGGWEQMVRMGIARNTVQDELTLWADIESRYRHIRWQSEHWRAGRQRSLRTGVV